MRHYTVLHWLPRDLKVSEWVCRGLHTTVLWANLHISCWDILRREVVVSLVDWLTLDVTSLGDY